MKKDLKELDKTKVYKSPSMETISAFVDGEWKLFRRTDVLQDLSNQSDVKEYEIDFGGHCKAKISVDSNGIRVVVAMNGYGDIIHSDGISIIYNPPIKE